MLGLDPIADRATIRRRTGVLLQRSGFSGDLTVRETLQMWSGTMTAPRKVQEMIELLSLAQRAEIRMLALSGGETRRVDLACTLMGNPELVILDEPTTGLDPESRRTVWQLVSNLRDNGATVLITTHYLEEAETLADRLEIMHAGRIVRSGSPTQIAAGHPSTISFAQLPGAYGVPERLAGIQSVVHQYGRTVVETDRLQVTLSDLLTWAALNHVTLDGLDARSPSLETVFLAIADGRDSGDSPSEARPHRTEGALR
jgi:ABC-2 type transport system ATP-binding protein